MESSNVISATEHWLTKFVIELQLCPFAQRELARGSIRFHASEAVTEMELLDDLKRELLRLQTGERVETTLLIHPTVLNDFNHYNQFLTQTDALLEEMSLVGVIQIASFHPLYQFAGTNLNDPENYTNRSPFPILHLLREASVERAIAAHPDAEGIPAKNIRLMNQLGTVFLAARLRSL